MPSCAGQSRTAARAGRRSKFTSPWWGGRSSERERAKKTGWGVERGQSLGRIDFPGVSTAPPTRLAFALSRKRLADPPTRAGLSHMADEVEKIVFVPSGTE